MAGRLQGALTPDQGRKRGRGQGLLAGAVFHALRRDTGWTQEQAAERLGVSVDLIAGWESGRRALARVSAEDLWRHQRTLHAAGAAPELFPLLDEAIRADLILVDLTRSIEAVHPLTTLVPGRLLTELLAWPISGKPPRQLQGYDVRRVMLPSGERAELVTALQRTAEAAQAGEDGAMLRRQATYLAAADTEAREWAAGEFAEEMRRPLDLGRWSPEWPVHRSAAISAAASDDLEPLQRFARNGLASDETVAANLTYWAYWVGELPAPWRADVEMITTPLQSWAGDKVLSTLIDGLVRAPYRELCAHTLHGLLTAKPHLASDSTVRDRMGRAIESALADDTLTDTARGLLRQVAFLVRSWH